MKGIQGNTVSVFDPLRKKFVALTPEEKVRQRFISAMADRFGVPLTHMMSEVSFRLGDKHLRADIVIYSRTLSPVCIIECKEEGVCLDGKVLEQAIIYNMVLNVPFICITNGMHTVMFRRTKTGKYSYLDHMPCYEEMQAYNV